jgi:hypothetical protein
MNVPEALLIGAVVCLGGILFGTMAILWRNRKQRVLRQEMKRHLQTIGSSGPYDPTSS